MRVLYLLALGAVCAFSQPIGGGLKAGIPFTDFLDNAGTGDINSFKHPKRFILGLTAELRLPFHLAIEVDALWRRMNYSGTLTGNLTTDVNTSGNTWEFPLLVKYRVGEGAIKPFVDGGFAWNRLSGLTETVRAGVTGQSIRRASNSTLRGLVLGAGLDIKVLFMHLEPEVRFTRWGAKRYFDVGDYFDHNKNQAEFLVGISF